MKKIDNCTVVIRSVGERTVELCRKLVEEQVYPENVFLINEVPFSKAVRRTFEIGLDNNLPWTIGIDADILLASNSIRMLISLAEKEGKEVFKFNGRLIDKFFHLPRHGSPHLYRTELCGIALQHFPAEETIRPETAVLDVLMKKTNIRYLLYEEIMGLHDYEQWYHDIYRKAFVHANKHSQEFVAQLLKGWVKQMTQDNDYLVAVAGLCKGLAQEGDVSIDYQSLPVNFNENKLSTGIEEKNDLINPPFNSCIEVKNYLNNIIYLRSHPFLSELKSYNNNASIKTVPMFIGYVMEKLGRRINSWASRN